MSQTIYNVYSLPAIVSLAVQGHLGSDITLYSLVLHLMYFID